MKILFLNTRNLEIKHLHMALALRDNTNHEIHFMHISPKRRILTSGMTSRFIEDAKNSNAFRTVQRFSTKRFERLKPDVTYVYDYHGVEAAQNDWDGKTILDIRDTELLNTASNKYVEQERKAATHHSVRMCLFGSKTEMELCRERYKLENTRVQYPFVAESTIPFYTDGHYPLKTEEFSVVYAGSIWKGNSYRNIYGLIEQFGKLEIPLFIYMLNSFDESNWALAKSIARKYTSISVFPRAPMFSVKDEIAKYHVGFHFGDLHPKLVATYGMKPLEYAYAGVIPVCVGKNARATYNLSDGKEFGYVSDTPENIKKNYSSKHLQNFDYKHHLMDSHINEFTELKLNESAHSKHNKTR